MSTETKTTTSKRALDTFATRGLNGQEEVVTRIKDRAAALWDEIDGIAIAPGNSDAGRLVALAKTELECAVMWAVKAVSRT